MIKVYQPKYYNGFSCTGNACKNNCCHHWTINIDEQTYSKFMSLDDDIKNEINEKLAFTENEKKEVYIKLDEQKRCTFLNESGLCTLQLRLGHDYLSYTCRTYPRMFCAVGGSPECFLELSCEEAAKLILFNNDYMNFEEHMIDSDSFEAAKHGYSHALDVKKYTDSDDGIDIFWKLRVASVAILQSRQFRIRFRMLILCLFIQEVAELLAAKRDSDVIALADEYMERLDNNHYNELYAELPYGAERETDVLIDILKDMCIKSELFMPVVERSAAGLDIKTDSWSIPDGFDDKYNRYYEMYFADKEYIFENYLVHRVLSEGFPFNNTPDADIMGNYVDLLAKYNIVEFLLTGVCRSRMKFDKRQIVDCITLFTRGYDHSAKKFLQTQ